MGRAESLFGEVLDAAIHELKREEVPLYTFAFYHDHESAAVSVCADTKRNSKKAVQKTNRYNMKYFADAIRAGDLEEAALWQANVGRNLSLGDFSHVNLARRDLERLKPDSKFHLKMLRAVLSRKSKILKLAPSNSDLLFLCSTADDEVGLAWTATEQGVV